MSVTGKPAEDPKAEDPEGLGVPEDASLGDYPIDTLLIRNDTRTVHDVLRRIEQGGFVMDPDFQRDFVWEIEKQSKLIESVLMRIPLPVFYLAEDSEGRTIVVDGLQRLTTFQRFVDNNLRLKLPAQAQLDGKRFQDLSPKLQNRLEDCNLILYIIDSKVPERARLDIFERVNAGVPLNRQQMRNCLYMGQATTFLKRQASTKLFKKATGGSLRSLTMRDREFVNRYCAFKLLSIEEYRDMDSFLASALMHMNTLTAEDLGDVESTLRLGLRNNLAVFGRHSFRKHARSQRARNVINASLWDVMSVGLSQYSEGAVNAHKRALRVAFYPLLEDADFTTAITYGTNSLKQVRQRFAMSRAMLAEVFDDLDD